MVGTVACAEGGPLGGLVLAVIYLPGMPRAAEAGRYGEVFNEIAEAYDCHRPAYPDALIDQACEVGVSVPAQRCSRSAVAPAS
jgi:hypothetical protein